MASYLFIWTPLVILGAMIVLLTAPVLALIVLMLVLLVAAAALASAIASVSHALSRSVSHRWQVRGGATPQTAMTLAPSRRQNA
jgi:hypothetical protein